MSLYAEQNSKLCPAGELIWYDLIANVAHEAARGREDAEANEKKTRKSHWADKSKADTRLGCRECSEGAVISR
jgi:U4/U6.U5 tri-snRNP-associated protein 2